MPQPMYNVTKYTFNSLKKFGFATDFVKNKLCNMIFPLIRNFIFVLSFLYTAVEQAVACASVTQRARVRSSIGTSFLGEISRVFSSPVRQMSGSFSPMVPRISFGHHNHPLSWAARQLILQSFRRRFIYVTCTSPKSPGETLMIFIISALLELLMSECCVSYLVCVLSWRWSRQ